MRCSDVPVSISFRTVSPMTCAAFEECAVLVDLHMLLHLRFVMKLSITDQTFVLRLLRQVHPLQVDAQVTLTTVQSVAHGTSILSLEVNRTVLFEALQAAKLAVTMLTPINPVLRMNVQMVVQIRAIYEGFLTVRALLGTYVQMHSAVLLNVVQIFATYRTAEEFLFSLHCATSSRLLYPTIRFLL